MSDGFELGPDGTGHSSVRCLERHDLESNPVKQIEILTSSSTFESTIVQFVEHQGRQTNIPRFAVPETSQQRGRRTIQQNDAGIRIEKIAHHSNVVSSLGPAGSCGWFRPPA